MPRLRRFPRRRNSSRCSHAYCRSASHWAVGVARKAVEEAERADGPARREQPVVTCTHAVSLFPYLWSRLTRGCWLDILTLPLDRIRAVDIVQCSRLVVAHSISSLITKSVRRLDALALICVSIGSLDALTLTVCIGWLTITGLERTGWLGSLFIGLLAWVWVLCLLLRSRLWCWSRLWS